MRHLTRNSALPIVASIAASLALLACGGDREARGVSPEETPVVAQHNAPAPKPAPAPAPVARPSESAPSWGDASDAEVADAQASAQPGVSFGSAQQSDDVSPARQQEAPLPDSSGHVFTNKDLERYKATRIAFGMEGDAKPASYDYAESEGGAADRKQAGGDKPLTPEEVAEQISATESEIAIVEKDLEYLKSRPASLRNPYLARVTPTEGDATAEAGMDNVQRLARVQERIGENEKKLGELKQKLESLRQTPPPSNQ